MIFSAYGTLGIWKGNGYVGFTIAHNQLCTGVFIEDLFLVLLTFVMYGLKHH